MSALGTLASTAVTGVWKIAAVILLTLLLMALSAGGVGWWMLAGARDEARAALVVEQGVSGELRAAIHLQNAAAESAGAAKLVADEKGKAAQQLAAANGKRLDQVLAQVRHAKATTCAEAMPTVNAILDAIH